MFVSLRFSPISTLFGHILVVGLPHQLFWINNHWSPTSPHVINYYPTWFLNQWWETMTIRLNDSMSRINCQRNKVSPEDQASDPWITNPMLYTYWANRVDLVLLNMILYLKHSAKFIQYSAKVCYLRDTQFYPCWFIHCNLSSSKTIQKWIWYYH